MNRRYPDSVGLPTPTATRAGGDRFVRRYAVNQGRHQNTDKTEANPDRRATTDVVAPGQPAKSVARQVQIGVTVQAAQPQSP